MKNLLLGLFFLSFFRKYTQISEMFFKDHLLQNTTGVSIYDHEFAYIKLNNDSHYTNYIALNNETTFIDFLEEKSVDVLYKKNNFKMEDMSKYILMFILLSFIFIKGNSFVTSAIFSEKKTNITLKDVAGLESNKQEAFEFVDFLKKR